MPYRSPRFWVQLFDSMLIEVNPTKEFVGTREFTDLKPLVSTSTSLTSDDEDQSLIPGRSSAVSRHRLVNGTDLRIEQTRLGDEGFYTLKAQTSSNQDKQYLYHVRRLCRKTFSDKHAVCIFFRSSCSHRTFLSSFHQHNSRIKRIVPDNSLISLVR